MDALHRSETVLGTGKKSSSGEYLFHCPFCYHHKAKLSINMTDRFGRWKCWVCNTAGYKINSLLYKMGIPQKERFAILGEFGDRYIPHDERDMYEPLRLPTEYHPLWWPVESYEYKNAISFLKRRGLSREDIIKHQIGYCETGNYSGRVIIPSYDSEQTLNYFISRSYYDIDFKYKNPPASKNNIVFENMIDWTSPVILVEGPFDAIAVRRNSIPLLGKVLYGKIQQKLVREKPPMIYIMMDSDAESDALRMDHWLSSNGLKTKFVRMDGKDPSDMGYEHSWKQILHSKESSFVDLIRSKLE